MEVYEVKPNVKTVNNQSPDGEGNVSIDLLEDLDGVLPVEKGGTGATTKAAAQTALGLNDAIVGLSVSGKDITYTQADGGTGTIATQDTTTKLKVW